MSLADGFRMDLNLVHTCNETPAIVSGCLERSTLRDGFRGRYPSYSLSRFRISLRM